MFKQSLSLDEQRERMAAFLANQRTAVMSAIAGQDVWSMPVWYRPALGCTGGQGLEVDCLVPRWADAVPRLSQNAEVLLIVQAPSGVGLRWVRIRGTASPVETPKWAWLLPRWVSTVQPDALYLVVRVAPSRIDLIDEDVGWGVQETLEW
jgi:hypothetical protein